jgi:hypothetical protein
VTGAAKAGGGRQESVENHTLRTTGNDGSVQWMTERGDGHDDDDGGGDGDGNGDDGNGDGSDDDNRGGGGNGDRNSIGHRQQTIN